MRARVWSWLLPLLLWGCAPALPYSVLGEGLTPRTVPVEFLSGALVQYATLYLPATQTPPPGGMRHGRPLVILLHSGFFGDDPSLAALGQSFADRGVIAAVPTYRGEPRLLDGARSEGEIEFCRGEVDDVLALLRALRRRPGVDPARVALWGFSHGGCIALRTAARAPGLRAVAAFSAPVEAGALYQGLSRQPLRNLGFNGWLGGRLRTWVGAPPGATTARWAARSALYTAQALPPRLLLVHGDADNIVPPAQHCWLQDALRKSGRVVRERRLGRDGREDTSRPPLCKAPEPPPPRLLSPAPVEAWVLTGQGHGYSRRVRARAHALALQYLLQQLSQ